MTNEDFSFTYQKFLVLLAAAGSAAIVGIIYHCIAVCLCNRHPANQSPRQARRRSVSETMETSISTNASMAQLIPAHKYQKGVDSMGDYGTCAVCLCEFEEGEELRTLSGCMHSFHAPCIDMWLYSHSTCPMCRSNATPLPSIFQHATDLGSGESEAHSGMLHDIVIQSMRA